MTVYYYKVSNHKHGNDEDDDHMIDMWLYKVNLKCRNPVKKKVLQWYDELNKDYITHFSFIIPYPDMNISDEDLEKDGGAIMYFREYGNIKWNSAYVKKNDEEDDS